jgi:FtsP/CotA-like multicopper oxidase with cupredoxin domain
MATIEIDIRASVPPALNVGGGNPPVTNAETFDGTIPRQPVIKAAVGDTLIIRLLNDLPHPTGIHWHGIELENYSDGTEVTQNEVPGGVVQTLVNGVPAGGTFLYKFNLPRPGIFWFHPHHHHSTNRTFRGQYGMIVVTEPAEATLIVNDVLPPAANTYQLVLSDVTVCKAMNDAVTYVDPTSLPLADRAEWLSNATAQNGPSPKDLCELDPLDDMGMTPGTPFGAGQIPNSFRMIPSMGIPPSVEGQTVLTNGVNVGPRKGKPTAPALLPDPGYTSISAVPGAGLRFQILNAATTRYFRLILTTDAGVQIPLIRVGGEGGILNDAIQEGGMMGAIDSKYNAGEILIPAGSRADVVAVIPAATTGTCTMWTRDFQRVGGGGWSQIPTVPVLHIDVAGVAVPQFPLTAGTALKSSIGSTPPLGPETTPGAPFLNPATFAPAKLGTNNPEIQLTAMPGGMGGINGQQGSFDLMPYTTNPHIAGSTRFAHSGDILQFTVKNLSTAHHPFHLHGFSFQPISLTPNGGGPGYTWPFVEYRDNLDVPAGHTLTAKVQITDRELADGLTPGGAYGRWLFHCHIFFHAHHGMISELVITDPNGKEKPNVNVNGSWAYSPSGGVASRIGTWSHPDGTATTLSASYGSLVQNPGGTWSWTSPLGAPDTTPHTYVYITATDTFGRQDQAVFRLKIGGMLDASDNGDPHIHTVDGKRYDFQAAGEFLALRDREGLEVQTRQTPVLTANPHEDSYTGLKVCVSLNTAVAARVGKHRIAYQPGKEPGQLIFYIDGRPAQLTARGISIDGNRVSGFDVNGVMGLRLDHVHGPVLVVTPQFWTSHKMWYLDVNISRTQADEGIMGAIPKGTWLPLLPTGASVGPMPASLTDRFNTLYKNFAKAWHVTDQSSLFVYERGTSTATFTDKDWPAGDPPCNLKPQFEIPGAPIPQGMPIDQAKLACQFIVDAGLNADCVFDMATIGDEEFARGYRTLQEIRQRSTAVQVVSLRPGEVTAIVSRMAGKERAPGGGKVTFYVDEQAHATLATDASGHATWKIDHENCDCTIRAEFTPSEGNESYPSSSPDLKLTLGENEHSGGGNGNEDGKATNKGCLAQWQLWVAVVLALALLLIWILYWS